MKNLYFNYKDNSFLKDIEIIDLLKLKEIGLNDSEVASELRIPKSHLSKLYSEYDVVLQGE